MNGLPCVVLQKVELFQIKYLFLYLYLYFTSRHLQFHPHRLWGVIGIVLMDLFSWQSHFLG